MIQHSNKFLIFHHCFIMSHVMIAKPIIDTTYNSDEQTNLTHFILTELN